MKVLSLLAPVVACCALLSSAAALATPVTVTITGLAGGGTPVSISSPPFGNGSAGALLGSLAPSSSGYSFLSHAFVSGPFTFCVELGQPAFFGAAAYNVVDPATGAYAGGAWGSALASAAISQSIDKLLSYALPLLTTSGLMDELAALQLAIWNVIYDAPGDVSLSTGTFVASANLTVDTIANGFLASYGSATATAHYFVATNDDDQDVLVVPEPGTAAMVALALAGLALTRKRVAATA